VADLFQTYNLLAQSGLFDAAYYLRRNPDVAALNIDPLLHYVERGAQEGRDPRPDFDAAFYLQQCRLRGEKPSNPLLHFITVGAKQGLRTRLLGEPAPGPAKTPRVLAPSVPKDESSPDRILWLDSPNVIDGTVAGAVAGGLSIAGWGLARAGVKAVNISVDGKHVSSAHFGVKRQDVAAAYPGRDGAGTSGFAALIPAWSLPNGRHLVAVTLVDNGEQSQSLQFAVDVDNAIANESSSFIRRRIAQSEVAIHTRILEGLKWRPTFHLLIATDDDADAWRRARLTLLSLRQQVYKEWVAVITSADRAAVSAPRRKALLLGCEDLASQLRFVSCPPSRTLAALSPPRKARDSDRAFISGIRAGDVLGCDALLEMAIATGMQREADFFYSDERRLNPATKSVDTYFKPAWSPDLLLSTNYIGRFWAAHHRLVRRSLVTVGDWLGRGEYDTVLRLTERARSVSHIPKVLCERDTKSYDAAHLEKAALARALRRRDIDATVSHGYAKGTYRVTRRRATNALVSILIPTCAARGLIRTCLTSLKAKTAYRNFEIICIENIPAAQLEWKTWLRNNANQVIETCEQFNWSRYTNLCAERATGDFLLFLNDDTEIVEPHWLDTLLQQAQRPEVGAVGPQLLYGDGTVQHAGLALTDLGRARHLFRHAQANDPGYFGLALTERNVIGVTGACMLTRRDVYDAVGRLTEAHSIINNDVDYCLKTWSHGYLNVYTPHTRLIHHELASRGELDEEYDSHAFLGKWRDVFLHGDPYLNPNLSRDDDGLTPAREPVRVLCAGHPLLARETVRRILLVKLDHIGDCVTAIPAVRRLRQLFPRAHISVLVNRATKSIWRMERAVDEILEFDFFHARSSRGKTDLARSALLDLRERLKAFDFDLAVDLRKSADTRQILQCTGARFLAGFDFRGQFPWLDIALEWEGDARYSPKRRHIADDLLDLVDAIANSCEPARSFMDSGLASRLTLEAKDKIFAKRVVCVHAASGNETRQWPTSYFSALIDLLMAHHDVHIVVIGGPDEMDVARRVVSGLRQQNGVYNLVGKVALAELPALIRKCALFIGNNSGPQHIAAALGVPTIGLHSGVVDAMEWGPLGDNAVAVQRKMFCSPCYIEKCNDCPRDLACLYGLDPGSVYRLACRMLLIRAAHPVRQSATP
jgi:O-antigen biosynthesis protein